MPKKSDNFPDIGADSRRTVKIAEMLRRENEQSLLLSISASIAAVRDKTDLLRLIVEKIKPVFDFYDCGVLVIDEEGGTYRDLAVLNPEIDNSAANQELSRRGFHSEKLTKIEGSAMAWTMRELEKRSGPLVFDYTGDLSGFSDAELLQTLQSFQYQEAIAALLKTGGKTFGVFFINSLRKNFFPADRLPLFQAVADLVAVGVANILANEDIAAREREKSALLAISQQISKSRSFGDLMEVMTDEIKPLLGFDDFVVAVFSKDKTKYKVINVNSVAARAERGFHPVVTENINKEIPLAGDVWVSQDRIAERTAPYFFTVSDRLEKYPGYYWLKMMRETGLRSSISQTLRHQNEIIGFLAVHFTHELENPEKRFPLIEGIAGQLATAVANLLANEEILEREREKSVLLAISEQLAAIRDKHDLFEVIFEKLQPVFRFDDAVIALYDEKMEFTRHIHSQTKAELRGNPNYRSIMSEKVPTAGNPHGEFAGYESPQIVTLQYLQEHYGHHVGVRVMKDFGLLESVIIPLRYGGRTLGTLEFHSVEPGRFSESQMPLFRNLGDQMAVTVSNILATEEILEREREKSVLLSISGDIAAARNSVELLQVIREKAQQLIPFYDTGILIIEPDGEHHFDLAVTMPGWEISDGNKKLQAADLRRLPHQGSYIEFVMRLIEQAKSPVIEDYERRYEEFEYPFFPTLQQHGYKEGIVTALKSGGKTFGTFWLNSLEKNNFSAQQFEIFQALADQVASAVSNILANEEILEREREKTLLLSLSEDIAAIRHASDLLRVVYDKIKTIFPFEDAGLFVLDRTGERHRDLFVDFGLMDNDLYKSAMPTGWITHRDSVIEKLMAQPGTRLIDLVKLTQKYPGYPQYAPMLEAGIKQLIGAPLKQGEKVLGMLFFNSTRTGFYTEKDFSLFESIANQIAVAVSNILSNEEILEREREKSVQLEIINALTATQTSEDLITKIASEINRIIRLDAFALHLQRDGEFLDFEYNDLRAVRENGNFVPLRRYAFWKEKGLTTEKLRELIQSSTSLLTRKAFYNAADYQTLARENELIKLITQNFGFRAIMYAPVRLQNGALMTLAASSRDENAFSAEILEKFCETGAQIALAVESNLAFAEISALKKRLEEENTYLAEEVRTAYDFGEIVGSAPALQEVFRRLELVAPTDTTVLLEGETGTGKELFARAIHDLSPRKTRPLIKINCAALPSSLIESELFGHERGAFTGANERRVGKFELANDGTIFLDEIGELPLELQAKLLRVLQEREVERIGGKMPLKINIRVVAATNRDLRSEVAAGRFRQDLFFRLNTVVLTLPALRERREDIPALALHFAQKYAARIGRRIRGISNKMLAELMRYDFPGNVRELEHIIEEAVIFSKGENLQLHRPLAFTPDQTAPIHISESDSRPPQTLAEIERAHILAVLEKTGGRIRGEQGAAEILNLKPTTLEARMKKLGIKKQHVFGER